MSARISLGSPNNGATRNSQRRKMVLDLNALPFECCNDVGTSSQTPLTLDLLISGAPPPESLAIDVDSIDDDVILTTPSAFAEAKYRRTRGRYNVVDVELAASEAINVNNNRNKRQRAVTNQPIIICEHVNLEGNYVIGNRKSVPHSMVPPPPPPPPEPTFSCPVCMNPLVEEMSTKCGHIFCKACIKQAIAAQGKCPTCRRKVTMKDTIRIYLPAANST